MLDSFATAAVEMLFVGRYVGQHRVEVWIGNPLQQSRKLGEVQWDNYDTQPFKANLLPEDLDSLGRINVTFVPRGTNERVSVSYLRWTYPQRLAAASSADQKTLFPNGATALRLDSARNARFFDVSVPGAPRQLPASNKEEQVTVTPSGSSSILVVRKPLSVTSLHPVKFRKIDSVGTNYLIITHPLVRKPVNGSDDPVADYAAYRASAAGGSFKPLVINAAEVFDQFNYGEPGPAGMRRLMRWLHDRAKLQYVLLLGQSRSPQAARKKPTARSEDMVPSAGWPDSDMALGVGLDPADPYTPLVPIGRVNAYTSQNVWDYLQKVKQHEAVPAAAPWRKNVLHLSGGRSGNELILFRYFTDSYASKIKGSFAAPDLQTISKKTDEEIERFPIAPIINEGVALMTLYGHSSLNVTDIEIGEVSKDALGYRNKGHYPAVIVNGCALGNFYFAGPPTSTDWILTPNRGAVLFVAHTHLGFTAALHNYTSSFYEALADPAFASRPFGDIMREGIRRNMSRNPTLSDRVTATQMGLQGDPALKIFPATRPDYAWQTTSVSVTNQEGRKISAWDDSLRVTARVANYGRFVQGTYTLTISRKKASQLIAEYTLVRRAIPLQDSLSFTFPNVSRQGGEETWEFRLDAENAIAEEDETNNLFSTQIQVTEGGAIPLLPADQSVFVEPKIELVAQIPAGRKTAAVVFEWSKSADFGADIQRDTVRTELILARKILTLTNPQIVYWRVRLAGDSAASASRSFRYAPDGPVRVSSLPEGIVDVTSTYPSVVDEGTVFRASVSFRNITDFPFRDSIRVLLREFYENKVLESTFKIAPLAAKGSYVFNFIQSTISRPGFHRALIYFNVDQLPEEFYPNNVAEVLYTVRPDRVPPLLDVMLDDRRLADGEAVSPQPKIQVRLSDSNPYLLRIDTTDLQVSLWKTCDKCPETLIPLEKATWSPTPVADFRVDFSFSKLTPGTYRLKVEGRDLVGNAAAPYEIRFRVAESNQIISTTASPNPADFWVKFGLELEGKNAPISWRVQVFDLNGKTIATLQHQPNLGRNEMLWLPAGVASGVYLYKMALEGEGWPLSIAGGKLLLVK
ncbi:C25 family cysteine peptidase [Persicitalea sp.]|uniref:putative type IX secretion system sortase PorU2 n=1 Tax=Persicitalea sp. TaxID=3100273 RepID=UPI0035944B8E